LIEVSHSESHGNCQKRHPKLTIEEPEGSRHRESKSEHSHLGAFLKINAFDIRNSVLFTADRKLGWAEPAT